MRIKYVLIEKLNRLTSKEMELFLYICRYQQLNGTMSGLHNQDVCKETGMCKQSFYNALNGLEKKGILDVRKLSEIDYDVVIRNNDFSYEEAFHEGYINLSRDVFRTKQFKKLAAKEKWMLFYFLHCTHEESGSYRIGVQKFYAKFCALLGVSKRRVRAFLHKLRHFFSIGIKDRLYYITYKHSVFHGTQSGQETIEHEHFTSSMARRSKIRKTESKELKDTAALIKQYRETAKQLKENIYRLLEESIRESVEGTERPLDRTLSAKFVHKILRRKLYLA